MKDLTYDEKMQITREMLHKEPSETLGQLALLKLSELSVNLRKLNQ